MKRRWKIIGGSVLAFTAFAMWASADAERKAVEAGFTDFSSQQEAKKAGFTTQAQVDAARTQRAAEAAQAAQVAEDARLAKVALLAAEDEFYAPRDEQRAFLNALSAANVKYKEAGNDLAKGAVRTKRGQAVCIAAPADIKDWSGTITTLSSNSDGFGVLEIEVGDNVSFKTWNNALSDIAHKTLIKPASSLSAVLSELKEGQRVRFSGKLFRDVSTPDCYFEGSMSLDGSMRSAEYIMRFSGVKVMP